MAMHVRSVKPKTNLRAAIAGFVLILGFVLVIVPGNLTDTVFFLRLEGPRGLRLTHVRENTPHFRTVQRLTR